MLQPPHPPRNTFVKGAGSSSKAPAAYDTAATATNPTASSTTGDRRALPMLRRAHSSHLGAATSPLPSGQQPVQAALQAAMTEAATAQDASHSASHPSGDDTRQAMAWLIQSAGHQFTQQDTQQPNDTPTDTLQSAMATAKRALSRSRSEPRTKQEPGEESL